MPTKSSQVWEVERTDWFGECDTVGTFHTAAEAIAFAKQCQRESDATDSPDDKVKYIVTEYTWTREA